MVNGEEQDPQNQSLQQIPESDVWKPSPKTNRVSIIEKRFCTPTIVERWWDSTSAALLPHRAHRNPFGIN